jgi:carnitine 3-dehydrogenase
MDQNTEINRVAIVGTGLIGGSWAACFLAHGLDVVATDPAPEAKDKVRHQVQAAWPALTKLGLAPGASTSRLRFESGLEAALEGADMVQENAPEREALKIKLFADIDSILPPPAILASSTSGIPMSRIQSECKHPERSVTGHPFNPPHLVSAGRGGRRSEDVCGDRRTHNALPHYHGKAGDAHSQGDRGTCGKPPPG